MKTLKQLREHTWIDPDSGLEMTRDEHGEPMLSQKGHEQMHAYKKQKNIEHARGEYESHFQHVSKSAYGGKTHVPTKEVKPGHEDAAAKAWRKLQHATNESTHPETYLDNPHIARLNGILDQITSKKFVNLQVFVDAVRAALDFHGFKLPHLDCEQETHGPSQPLAYGDIMHGPGFEDNRNVSSIPTEFEYIFQIKYDTMSEAGYPFPLYLYMCANRVDQDGDTDGKLQYWETYAQVVTPEELADLSDMVDDRETPEPVGDASGETEYLRKQRHVNTTGTSPDEDL